VGHKREKDHHWLGEKTIQERLNNKYPNHFTCLQYKGLYSDQRFYRDLHFHVNGKGLVSYITVPESWMQKLEKRNF
jgi:hypothetical protein